MKLERTDNLEPKCPQCKRELDTILYREHGMMVRHLVYMCPHCQSVLGVGKD